jgi:hypothetical protein
MAMKDPESPEEKSLPLLWGEGMGDLQGLLAIYECFVRGLRRTRAVATGS